MHWCPKRNEEPKFETDTESVFREIMELERMRKEGKFPPLKEENKKKDEEIEEFNKQAKEIINKRMIETLIHLLQEKPYENGGYYAFAHILKRKEQELSEISWQLFGIEQLMKHPRYGRGYWNLETALNELREK